MYRKSSLMIDTYREGRRDRERLPLVRVHWKFFSPIFILFNLVEENALCF